MKKFLLIYHSPKEAMEKFASMSEEEVQGVMGVWMKWKETHVDAVVDFGNPVGPQHVTSVDGSKLQEDDVTGYGIVQAESLEAAQSLLKDHPVIMDNDGSTVSVYPVHEM